MESFHDMIGYDTFQYWLKIRNIQKFKYLCPKIIVEMHFMILLNLLFRYGIKFETGKFFVVTIINKTQICRSKETQVCLLGSAKNLVEDKICAIFVSSMIWIIRTSLSWFTMYMLPSLQLRSSTSIGEEKIL